MSPSPAVLRWAHGLWLSAAGPFSGGDAIDVTATRRAAGESDSLSSGRAFGVEPLGVQAGSGSHYGDAAPNVAQGSGEDGVEAFADFLIEALHNSARWRTACDGWVTAFAQGGIRVISPGRSFLPGFQRGDPHAEIPDLGENVATYLPGRKLTGSL